MADEKPKKKASKKRTPAKRKVAKKKAPAKRKVETPTGRTPRRVARSPGQWEKIGKLTEALSNILLGEKIAFDVSDSQNGEIIIAHNRKITKTQIQDFANSYDRFETPPSPLANKIHELIGIIFPETLAAQAAKLIVENEALKDPEELVADIASLSEGITEDVRELKDLLKHHDGSTISISIDDLLLRPDDPEAEEGEIESLQDELLWNTT